MEQEYINLVSSIANEYCPESYEILGFYHEDDLCFVYKAKQGTINREVFLSILKPGLDLDGAYFLKKVKEHSAIQHEHIENIIEAGEVNGNIYFSQPKIVFTKLSEIIAGGIKLDRQEIFNIIGNISKAKTYLNENSLPTINANSENIIKTESHGYILKNQVNADETSAVPEKKEIISFADLMYQISLKEKDNIVAKFIETLKGTKINSWANVYKLFRKMEFSPVEFFKKNSKNKAGEKLTEKRLNYKIFIYIFLASLLAALLLIATVIYLKKQAKLKIKYVLVDRNDLPEKFNVKKFYMSKYEITIGQYASFLQKISNNEKRFSHPEQPSSKQSHIPKDWKVIHPAALKRQNYAGVKMSLEHPVFNIDWWDAYAFAAWAGARLPTKQEWQYAAFGKNGSPYPWGKNLIAKNFNSGLDYSTKIILKAKKDGYFMWATVNAHPLDVSPSGVYNLAGNVSEWTSSLVLHPLLPDRKIPAICGASFVTKSNFKVNADKSAKSFEERLPTLGIRLVKNF